MGIQPNGTCNLSRIDDISIQYEFTPEFLELVNSNIFRSDPDLRSADGIETGIYIGTYCLSYNVLRFMSGMAGLAFQTST